MSTSHDATSPQWPMPPDESGRLAALREYEILDTPPDQVFDELTWLASFICQTPMALVTLIDRHRQWFKSRIGLDSAESPRSESICAHAIMNPDRVLEVPDASKDRRFAAMPAIAGGPCVRFYAGAPLVGARGHAVGTICVMDRQPRTLSEDQRQALRILAAQAASQLELRVRLRAVQDKRPPADVARLKDEFLATVSSELRAPLTTIRESLQRLNADIEHARRAELVGVALNNADGLIRMVDDILDAARIEAGALKLQRRTLTVDALAGIALDRVRPIAAGAGVRLKLDIEPGVRVVHVDVDRMVQALVNLLSNAIKFAPRATTVTFAARRMADGGVSMQVHDEGGGIPPERLNRLFEKSTQVHPASIHQGKDTGLSLTKALVEEHGGTIHVSSGPDTGTTFEIRLGGDGTSFAKVSASPRSDG